MKKIVFVIMSAMLCVLGCSGNPNDDLQGSQGEKGSPGPAGPLGPTGNAGAAGIDGEKGIQGARGDQGLTGVAGSGPSVDGSKIVTSIHCNAPLETFANRWVTYDVVQFYNGNLFVSGAISDVYDETSASQMYAPTQNGWINAGVIVAYDLVSPANGGWWQLSLNRTTLVTSVRYNDTDIPAGFLSWTMTPDKCIVNNY